MRHKKFLCGILLFSLCLAGAFIAINNVQADGKETYLSTNITVTSPDTKDCNASGNWECDDTSCTFSLSQGWGTGSAQAVLHRKTPHEIISVLNTDSGDTYDYDNSFTLISGAEYYITVCVYRSDGASLYASASLSD